MLLRCSLIALIAIALPAAADIYKWVDETGAVHYSDEPPPANADIKKHVKERAPAQPGTDATPAGAPNSAAEEEMEFRQRQVERDKAEAQDRAQLEQAEINRRNCEQARNSLAALEARSRLTKYGPNGERIYLSDEEIADATVEAQAAVKSWCK